MEKYDAVVAGGGIAGSVAARFLAAYGLKTLLIERFKTPRNKPCSGLQLRYFEKLIGAKIPPEKLCKNELSKVVMITPSEKVLKGRMRMLNFWRSSLDSWLNTLAAKAGADFLDETPLLDFHEYGEWMTVRILTKSGEKEIKTRYLVGADGSNSRIRRKLRPHDFEKKTSGAAINYYFVGNGKLDPNALYMFYKREFAPLMFAWAYLKDDKWVIGTGAENNPLDYADRFFKYVKQKYSLRGDVIKKEGFTSPLKTGVYLGQRNLLMAGDAAGLIDLYRGLGMDNAALSGQFAAKAIIEAEETGSLPIEHYQQFMKRMVHRLERNAEKQAARYSTNETLRRSMSFSKLMISGLLMIIITQIDRFLPSERVIMLPT